MEAISPSRLMIYAAFSGLFAYFFLHKVTCRGDIVLGVEILTFFATWTAIKSEALVVSTHFDHPAIVAALCSVMHAVTLVTMTILYRISTFHPLSGIPGPLLYRVSSLRYAGLVMSGWRHKVVQSLHDKYGDCVRIGPNAVSINNRAAIGPIYTSTQCLDGSDAYSLHTLPGDGLLFVRNKEKHNRRRNRWAPAFNSINLDKFQHALNQRAKQLTKCIISRRDSNGLVDLSTCIEHWSYDFMGDFMFGSSSELEFMRDGDPLHWIQDGKKATAIFDILGEVPWLLDILWYFPQTQPIRQLHAVARRLMSLRKSRGSDLEGDIASNLLTKSHVEERDLTDDEMVMDALFGIQAGSDTSANILQYAFLFLIIHQNSYKELQKELTEAFPDVEAEFEFSRLASLSFLNAVINESLRLGTPLSGLPRVVPSGRLHFDGYMIPMNTVVSVPAYTQHHDPRNFWPSPESYIPERWLPGGLGPGSRVDPNAVMSFSFGPFGCIGRALAIQELRVVIARLVLDFDMEFPVHFDAVKYRNSIRNIRTTFFPSSIRPIVKFWS